MTHTLTEDVIKLEETREYKAGEDQTVHTLVNHTVTYRGYIFHVFYLSMRTQDNPSGDYYFAIRYLGKRPRCDVTNAYSLDDMPHAVHLRPKRKTSALWKSIDELEQAIKDDNVYAA